MNKIHEKAVELGRKLIERNPELTDWVISKFPELKESEDDRMIRIIIKTLQDINKKDASMIGDILLEDCIAWLEKQGEQKPTDIPEDFEKLVEHLLSLSDGEGHGSPAKVKEVSAELLRLANQQKPADKVEPKFKAGDWITNGEYTWKVIDIKPLDYILQSPDGVTVDDTISHVDEHFHLWTIQDANDGDVLYLQINGKEHIIIYKGVIKERFRTFVSAYCAYDGIVDAFCFADVSRYVDIAYKGIMPATKEQRDTLMKAMADDGYEWDAKKKELKKIEQEPTWGEEDEIHLKNAILSAEKECGLNSFTAKWLKSLKNRVQPKPKQEWSDEDEECRGALINICLIPHDEMDGRPWDKWANWLKSIKPNHWKPSEYDISLLEEIARNIRNNIRPFCSEVSHLEDLIKDLKNL